MGQRKRLSSGGAILAASALLGCGIVGCGGSTDPHNGQIVGAPGQTGTGGSGEPVMTGAGGSAATGTAPGSTIFAENYGDEGEQFLAGLATDASGNVYVAGNEMPVNIAVPGTPEAQLQMQGKQNGVFLLQYSATGQLMWRQPFTPTASSTLEFDGVAVQPTTDGLLVEVNDGGPGLPAHIAEHGPRLPPPTAESGRGLWLARQFSQRLYIWNTAHGLTVRLYATRA